MPDAIDREEEIARHRLHHMVEDLEQTATPRAAEWLKQHGQKTEYLDIPDTLETQMLAFQTGQISRDDFKKALASEHKSLRLGTADATRHDEALTRQIEEAAKRGIEVHAGIHLPDEHDPRFADLKHRTDEFFKPIDAEFRARTGIDPMKDHQVAIDQNYRGFARQWAEDHGLTVEFNRLREEDIRLTAEAQGIKNNQILTSNPRSLMAFGPALEAFVKELSEVSRRSGADGAYTHEVEPPCSLPQPPVQGRIGR